MLGFEYRNIYFYKKNNRLINQRSFTNYDHFNKVLEKKKQLGIVNKF